MTFITDLVKKATRLCTSTFTAPLLPARMGNRWKNSYGKFTNTSKKVFRIIKNAPFWSHAAPLLKKHEILTVHNVINQKICLVMYNLMKTDPGLFIQRCLSRAHKYELRHTTCYKEKIRTNYGMQKTSHQIPQLLNEPPITLSIAERSVS